MVNMEKNPLDLTEDEIAGEYVEMMFSRFKNEKTSKFESEQIKHCEELGYNSIIKPTDSDLSWHLYIIIKQLPKIKERKAAWIKGIERAWKEREY